MHELGMHELASSFFLQKFLNGSKDCRKWHHIPAGIHRRVTHLQP